MIVIATLEIYNPPKNLQGMTKNFGLTLSVGDALMWLTINMEKKKIRISDIECVQAWSSTQFHYPASV